MKCGKLFLEFHWLTIDKMTEVYFSSLRAPFLCNLNVKSKKSNLPKLYTVLIVCEMLSFESVASNLLSEGLGAEQVPWHLPCPLRSLWRAATVNSFILTVCFREVYGICCLVSSSLTAPAGFLPSPLSLGAHFHVKDLSQRKPLFFYPLPSRWLTYLNSNLPSPTLV